jgi:steroid delta-isomerase-like uncharacterized protein
MSSEHNKQIVRRAYQTVVDGIRSGDLSRLEEVVDRNVRDHNPDPNQKQGLDGLIEFFSSLGTAFPNMEIVVEDLIAEGDRVVGRVIFRGTHSGEFQGMPPTGKQLEMQVVDIMRIEEGKIVERWGVADNLAMMQQLGMAPA